MEGLRSLEPDELQRLQRFATEKHGQQRNRWVDVRFQLRENGSVAFPKAWLSKKQQTSHVSLSSFISNTIRKPSFRGETLRYGVHKEEVFIIWVKKEEPGDEASDD